MARERSTTNLALVFYQKTKQKQNKGPVQLYRLGATISATVDIDLAKVVLHDRLLVEVTLEAALELLKQLRAAVSLSFAFGGRGGRRSGGRNGGAGGRLGQLGEVDHHHRQHQARDEERCLGEHGRGDTSSTKTQEEKVRKM